MSNNSKEMEQLTEIADDPREYVDLMLEIKDGKVVGCDFYGEGRQAEPLIEPITFFTPGASDRWTRGLERVARRIKLRLGKLLPLNAEER